MIWNNESKITSTSIRIAFLGHLFSKKIPKSNFTCHNQLRSKRNSSLDQILFHPSWTLVPLFDKVKWQYLQSAPKNMLFLFRKMELFYHFTVKAGSLSHLYVQKSETNIYQIQCSNYRLGTRTLWKPQTCTQPKLLF